MGHKIATAARFFTRKSGDQQGILPERLGY
jgi:hypothetical protein